MSGISKVRKTGPGVVPQEAQAERPFDQALSEEKAPDENKAHEESLQSEDDAFIGKLEKIWNPHDGQSLPLRHKLGQLIIEKFKELDKDQSRGRLVLTEAADRLGMSVSDLSRMRAFASRFPTFEAFTGAHPSVKVWSEVKKLLAQLGQVEKKDSKGKSENKKSTDRQRDLLVEKLTENREEISRVKEDFAAKQLKAVRNLVAEILDEIEGVVEPLRRPLNSKEDKED